jgi:hypothetical protein
VRRWAAQAIDFQQQWRLGPHPPSPSQDGFLKEKQRSFMIKRFEKQSYQQQKLQLFSVNRDIKVPLSVDSSIQAKFWSKKHFLPFLHWQSAGCKRFAATMLRQLHQQITAIALATTVSTAILSRPAAAADSFNLHEATITSIQEAFNSGLLNSQKLVQLYLNRINAYDPLLNSIISINPNALAVEAALDAERATSGARSMLMGIPILIKDNIDTSFLPTTAGFLGLKDSLPPDNATITQKLIDAGAIILGKTSLTEFANYLTSGMPAGYNSLNGYTLNP